MEKLKLPNLTYPFIFVAVFSLSLLAFIFCIVAEFKKSKDKDVKLDGKLCELPESEAFGFGVAALVFLSTAQIIGNLMIFFIREPRSSSPGDIKSCCRPKRLTIASILVVLSWLSFVIALMLLSTAASMSRRQPYGKGWLDGECYLVKNGIFSGAAILILLSLGCTLASAVLPMRKKLLSVDQNAKKVPVQDG